MSQKKDQKQNDSPASSIANPPVRQCTFTSTERHYHRQKLPTEPNVPPPSKKTLKKEEEERVIAGARKETLEEAVSHFILHMMARCEDSGEEPTPINDLEALSIRHRNTTSSSSTPRLNRHKKRHRRPLPIEKYDSGSENDEDFIMV